MLTLSQTTAIFGAVGSTASTWSRKAVKATLTALRVTWYSHRPLCRSTAPKMVRRRLVQASSPAGGCRGESSWRAPRAAG
jgi:hypothetical protein